MIPKILLCGLSRPMCVSLFIRDGFRQAGCIVKTAGPNDPEVYGHTFPDEDWMRTDYELPNAPCDIEDVFNRVATSGFTPDAIVAVDQYDPFYLIGQTSRTKFVAIAVENWNAEQYDRSRIRRADAEFYMIAHNDNGRTIPPPVPPAAQWLPFGFDPFIHPLLGLERRYLVCQIGTPYEPRPSIWNALRRALDDESACSEKQYATEFVASRSTIFGRAPNYHDFAEAYNHSVCAISCSNVDFVPMRAPEAFGMGCVLLSDDVPTMRAVFGAPYAIYSSDQHAVRSTTPSGIWIAHDRTARGIEDAIRCILGVMTTTERSAFYARAVATAYSRHTYAHRARTILERVGLRGTTRIV